MDKCGSAEDIFLWCCGNRRNASNQYSDFLMSTVWLVWVVDENLITHLRWWMCGWPVAMHRAPLHWCVHCWIDSLPGSCCEGERSGQQSEEKELLNINPVIFFQGPGSWRGQWAEGLHVDLCHRLPPGGSLLWLFLCLSWWAGGAGRDAVWQDLWQDREQHNNPAECNPWRSLMWSGHSCGHWGACLFLSSSGHSLIYLMRKRTNKPFTRGLFIMLIQSQGPGSRETHIHKWQPHMVTLRNTCKIFSHQDSYNS